MPSSLIFAGLVVLWLLILVPAVARRQQEVARLSPAVLSGRVLERPMRHRLPEVYGMERRDDGGATTVGELVEQRDDVPSPRDRADADDALGGPEAGDRHTERREHDRRAHARIPDEHDLDRELDRDFHDDGDEDRAAGENDPGDRRPGTSTRREDVSSDGDLQAEDPPDDDRYADDGYEDRDDDEPDREPLVARYRPGRGGFDPEAAEAAAHAKYAFRQRVVLGLLVLLLVSAALALLVAGVWWWVAGATGLTLAGYLTYLRRQVRIEEAIRRRRTERLAGLRRTAADDAPAHDDRSRPAPDAGHTAAEDTAVEDDEDEDWTADDGEPSRVRGTGAPLGVLPARVRTVEGPGTEHESSLPRVRTAPTPPVPAGTSLVDVDDEEQLDAAVQAEEHRRAAGE